MKERLANLVAAASRKLVSPDLLPRIDISIPQERFGDFSTNLAILLAPVCGKPPFEIAAFIADRLKSSKLFEKVEPMRNGFVNFTLTSDYLQKNLSTILKQGRNYGRSGWGGGKKALVEFVSANPTGPLHVGHGRWAVIGDDIASLLEAAGYRVEREYYINDVGAQVDKLEQSVVARMEGRDVPEGGYGGAYIYDIAQVLRHDRKNLKPKILDILLKGQKATLHKLGVKFDRFFRESDLHRKGKVKDAVFRLEMRGATFKEDGALWFKSQELGDDKNRVLTRETGETTYFAADIAYHMDKFKRNYGHIINVWGADHHGYVHRLKAALKVLGLPVERFEVIIGQLVSLYRGKELVKMSKRTGEMITLDEVVDEVGRDATRFFMTATSVNSHLDFDLELAKQQAANNPVYYVQYAHARISSILREARERRVKRKWRPDLSLLVHPSERKLMRRLLDVTDEILIAAKRREPHTMVEYAKSLAAVFHNFYHQCRVISDDAELTSARLVLSDATRITLRNVLELLKVSAPERM